MADTLNNMIAIGVIILILSATLLVIGSLAALKKLPGNGVIGLRVEEVRKSKEIWDTAHAVAGPVWILAGVTLLFGGAVALRASGWGWLIPIASVIIAVVAYSVGANLGARAAYLANKAEENKDKPAVNISALRQAAQSADREES